MYCWVIVEAPSLVAPVIRSMTTARAMPTRVDALVLVEALVLDGDHGA